MKYVILIYSNPNPWGHPTQKLTPEGRALSAEQTDAMDREFDSLMREISDSGEFVTAEALGDPTTSTLYTWGPDGHVATDGPYAETKEQVAGFFIIDTEIGERADEIAARVAQPGGTVELRPVMWPGGGDQ